MMSSMDGWQLQAAVGVQALANCHTPLYKGKRQILARAKAGKVPLLLGFSRRSFLKSLSRSATVLSLENILGLSRSGNIAGMGREMQQGASAPAASASTVTGTPLGVSFLNVAKEAGLNAKTIFGGEHKNKYLLETTGCGVAFYDYDNDGWLDIFLVNGTRLEGFPAGSEPTSHLFRNNGDGTFRDVSQKAGVAGKGTRWNTGCAFVDYDRDGRLDLFVANYIDLDLATAPVPESGPCLYKSVMVACGPPGLQGGKNILYHNNGDGTFTDVSDAAGIFRANGTYGLGVLTADLDNDGWPDIYVANDSTATALYHNKKNGTFEDIAIDAGCALSPDGKPQAGMGISAADYDLDGNLDLVKTNFAGDTPSLYHNLGGGTFEDATFTAGLGAHTQFLGWGCGFFDFDNDGWPDILICNGHVYPEVEQLKTEAGYPQRKLLYQNLHNGRFADVSFQAGSGISDPAPV